MSTPHRRRWVRRVVAVGAATALCVSIGVAVRAAAHPDAPAHQSLTAATAGMHLVADEEFDTYDTSQWTAYDSTSSNGVSHYLPSQVKVTGGELQIIGEGRDPTGADNISGAVCWCGGAGNQTYGIWGFKAKFDAGTGYGPAMLLWPQSGQWPQDGETDLVESVQPDRSTDLGSVHWGTSTSDTHRESGDVYGDYTQWHVYWVDWQPDYIRIYVDQTLVYDTETTGKATIPSTPMHAVIQQEPGPYAPDTWLVAPDSSTPDQVVMHVDWVRVYQ